MYSLNSFQIIFQLGVGVTQELRSTYTSVILACVAGRRKEREIKVSAGGRRDDLKGRYFVVVVVFRPEKKNWGRSEISIYHTSE